KRSRQSVRPARERPASSQRIPEATRTSALLVRPASELPLEGARPPGIEIPDDQDEQEDEHLHQTEHGEPVERNRPREDEDRLDIEDDEQHRDEVIPDAV